jgi:hypothetical protein
VEGAQLAGPPQPVGKTGEHVAITLRRGPAYVRVMAWKWGPMRDRLRAGMTCAAVVRPAISRWNGRESCEPELLDLRPE